MSPLTIIIGGGAAGMVAAIESARNGNETILLEKNEKLGKKLYITGKGRCNITNLCDEEEFLKNIIGNPYFLYSSIYAFNAETCIKYFEELGLPLKVERGNRVFPKSDKSSDVTRVLEKTMRELGVKIRLNTEVLDIVSENGKITAVKTASENISCDKVIVATGGLSYPQTGSTGDGYKFAKKMGHEVTALYPSLVSIEAKENWVKNLAGVSLKNVELSVKQGKKVIYKGFGEMLFSHKGISGPLVLTASRKIVGIKSDLDIFIDLKPALSEKELDTRLLKDFEKFANKDFKNSLDDLLPQSLIPVFVDLSLIS
ncbi:MAG: aminoacetone oxidase family FAD-binding enzyme, partial [Defluviitaleaceae bacterium]|nr:aminoacetone oxidase family FAD-binding enzyme [Defluviitaleaceae bacterium]